MKYYVRQIAQWIASFLCMFILGNVICFFFYRPSIDVPRNNGANNGFWMPNMKGWYTKEGAGVICADSNGYPNPELPRAEGYYVLAGSSHTEAVYLLPGQRYSDLVNERLGGNSLHVYNIAHGGFVFSDILGRLDGMAYEFPDAGGLIIETFTVDLDEAALDEINNQAGPGETDPQTVFNYYDAGGRDFGSE